MTLSTNHWLIGFLRGTLFLAISAAIIGIAALNNSVFLVTGSNIGVTLVRVQLSSQIISVILLIMASFLLIYNSFRFSQWVNSLIFVLCLALYTVSMHSFAWNYTDNRVEDIWLLKTVQSLPIDRKQTVISCREGQHWYILTHKSGRSIQVYKGFYRWRLLRGPVMSGCRKRKRR